jgi:hypothetical protein
VLVRAHCWFNQRHLTHVSTITLASLIKRSTQQRGKGRTKRESTQVPARSGSQMGQGTNYVPKPPPVASKKHIRKGEGTLKEQYTHKSPLTCNVKIEAACTLCKATSQTSLLRSMFPPSGHSEPAPTSTPSTGCLLLLSCG